MRLTLRTLLAYLDDTLPGDEAKAIGQKVAESPTAKELIETIKRVTRRRRLSTPPAEGGNGSDPNTVAEYLSDTLPSDQTVEFEKLCLDSDVHLAEVAACHQILTLLLSEPVRVPPTARQRMYRLVTGPESLPNKKPGNTVPVGGVLPDEPLPNADDSDAAYLLGMKAYGQTENRGQKIAQLAILAALVAGLGLTAYAAWPSAAKSDLPPKRQEIAAVVPANGEKKPEPPKVEPKAEPPAVPMPAAVDLSKEEPAVAPAPMVEGPPPMDLVPKPQPPKEDRVTLGVLETPDRVVLANRDGKWVRVAAKDPALFSAEKLVALPGYKANFKTDSGAGVELWGNLPEQQPIPILDTAVTFHPPYDGFDADLTLHTGRIYLTAKKPTGTTVRVRCLGEIWDVTLPDDKADVVVEVTHRLMPGLTADVDPSEKPQTTLLLAVLKGTAKLKARYKPLPELTPNDAVTWSSKGAGLVGPKKLPGPPPGLTAGLFPRAPLPASETLGRAVQATLAEFADRFRDMESVRVRFAEMFADPGPGVNETMTEAAKRAVRPCVAVLGYAALGDLPPVVDGLIDDARPRVRDAAVYGLHALAATSPDALDQLTKILTEKSRLTADQAKTVVRLVRGVSDAERADPKALDQLVEHLNSPALVIRELAFWQLLNEVDPEARSMKALSGYDAAAGPLAREGSFNSWKRRVEDLKKKLPEQK
jgi:hypothetical protein